MASLPPRQASQRRPSPEQTSEHPSTSSLSSTSSPPSTSQRPRSQSGARSTVSEDSQTLLLNSPQAPSAQQPEQTSSRPPPQPQDDQDVKKCWICFADETEDTPESSAWRDPCPCALVAHEDCLLDWIADMESPSSRKRTLGPPQLLCPQCKSEIHLARPRDAIVELVRASERVAAKIVTPLALFGVGAVVVHAFAWHGQHSVYEVFGRPNGWRILRPVMVPRRVMTDNPLQDFQDWIHDFTQHWRLRIGLPLITPMLVLSRTTFADSVLPVLPIVFFATQGDSDQPLDFGHWPPSASLAMAVLPYLRGLYNAYYERVWAAHERRWIKEIQPRNGQSSSQNDNPGEQQNQEGNGDDAEEEGIFEIRVDGNIWDDWDGGGEEPRQQNGQGQGQNQIARERAQIRQDMEANGAVPNVPRDAAFHDQQQAPPLNAPPLADNQPANLPQPPANQPQQQPAQPAQGERRLSISTTGLAEKVLGALLFPTVAKLSGEALRLLLPKSWTSRPYGRLGRGSANGLLQEQWGRSIVGGCLFVVLKDAIVLYARWQMARQHRKRRVLDYDRKKARG